jgi:hypothetical protein
MPKWGGKLKGGGIPKMGDQPCPRLFILGTFPLGFTHHKAWGKGHYYKSGVGFIDLNNYGTFKMK